MNPKQTKRAKNPDTPEATSKYYITNGKMLPEVISSKAEGQISDELAKMLMMLTRKYAQRPCFSGYTYKEDMISEALANLCQNALKFNPEKSSNPFAFYTSCINNSFLQFLNVEKKHRRIRDQLLVDVGENPSFNFQDEAKHHQDTEYHVDFTELKTNIEEAKVRLDQDAIQAAAKAAKIEALIQAELLAKQTDLFDDDADCACTLNFDEFIKEEEVLVPNLSLLDFDEDQKP